MTVPLVRGSSRTDVQISVYSDHPCDLLVTQPTKGPTQEDWHNITELILIALRRALQWMSARLSLTKRNTGKTSMDRCRYHFSMKHVYIVIIFYTCCDYFFVVVLCLFYIVPRSAHVF